jgi:hypothetical protein
MSLKLDRQLYGARRRRHTLVQRGIHHVQCLHATANLVVKVTCTKEAIQHGQRLLVAGLHQPMKTIPREIREFLARRFGQQVLFGVDCRAFHGSV